MPGATNSEAAPGKTKETVMYSNELERSNQVIGSAEVELVKVTRGESGALLVEIRSGEQAFSVECSARDLQTFHRFQRRVADMLGLWASHQSQESISASGRSEFWQDAVAFAFDKGATR